VTEKISNGSLIKSPRPSNLFNIKIYLLMLEEEMLMHTRLIQDGTRSSSSMVKILSVRSRTNVSKSKATMTLKTDKFKVTLEAAMVETQDSNGQSSMLIKLSLHVLVDSTENGAYMKTDHSILSLISQVEDLLMLSVQTEVMLSLRLLTDLAHSLGTLIVKPRQSETRKTIELLICEQLP
jgi:hypothetical protein